MFDYHIFKSLFINAKVHCSETSSADNSIDLVIVHDDTEIDTVKTSSYNCGGIEEFTEGSVSNMYSTKRFIAWATLDGSRDEVSNLEIENPYLRSTYFASLIFFLKVITMLKVRSPARM